MDELTATIALSHGLAVNQYIYTYLKIQEIQPFTYPRFTEMKRVKEILSDTQRIRGQVPDSCLSCEYSILWEGFEFIKGASRESCFSTSKDDSLDKKQIQIIVVIVVKVVKLIFYFQKHCSTLKKLNGF